VTIGVAVGSILGCLAVIALGFAAHRHLQILQGKRIEEKLQQEKFFESHLPGIVLIEEGVSSIEASGGGSTINLPDAGSPTDTA
jgi:hypothetical protein